MPDSRAQVSPGPLARAHEQLEGATQCFRCHGSKRRDAGMNTQCLNCHGEIAWLVQRKLGLHGREEMRDCQSCHPDHAGRDFELIVWESGSAESFDHDRTGWPLTAAHARVECAACHRAEFQKGDVVRLRKRSDPDRSWLGLSRDCSSCHQDPHAGSLGADCTQCHQRTVWKPAAGFDHAESSYPLDGEHVDVPCAECHLPSLPAAQRYSPAFDDCSACHEDPHRPALGSSCSSCHSTSGFRNVDTDRFDHTATRFPLIGRHASVTCDACHDERTAWGRRPAFARCDSCHVDAHAGQTDAGTDCAACHDERGYRPSTFSVADHRSTDYPLEGKHAEVRCEGCHAKVAEPRPEARLGSAAVPLHPEHASCTACHHEAHADQLAGRADGGACESCHNVAGWRPSTFSAERHAESRLPLVGRHADAACRDCHGPNRSDLPALPGESVLGSAGVAVTTLDASCASCHLDPHAGSLEATCESCHSTERFNPSRVDVEMHATFDYRLEGAHRAVPCVACHEELALPRSAIRLQRVAGSLRELRFTIAEQSCESCHPGPHGSQFDDRANGGSCESCHDVTTFAPAVRFDHDRDSSFTLGGGHRGVACAACHPLRPHGQGRLRTVYRPVPSACRDCHSGVPANTATGAAR